MLRITIVYNINDRDFTTHRVSSFYGLTYVTARKLLLIFLWCFLALEDFEDREQKSYCVGQSSVCMCICMCIEMRWLVRHGIVLHSPPTRGKHLPFTSYLWNIKDFFLGILGRRDAMQFYTNLTSIKKPGRERIQSWLP